MLPGTMRSVWVNAAWDGAAILGRGCDPIPTRRSLPGDTTDEQSRYIEAAVQGVLVGYLRLPNGNPQPGLKCDFKLRWFDRLIRHTDELHGTGLPVVVAGDYNVVPTSANMYPSRSMATNALVLPESRATFRALLAQGWTDAVRSMHPTDPMYSFWADLREQWPRDAVLRLDHLLPSLSVERCVGMPG